MSVRYRTSATALTETLTAVPGGLSVAVGNPLRGDDDTAATNPEQLLALAWATCLNATAQVLADGRTRVRVEVELADAEDRPGYEFHVTAVLSAEGLDASEADALAASAHARCPVSRLLHGASTVSVRTEPWTD